MLVVDAETPHRSRLRSAVVLITVVTLWAAASALAWHVLAGGHGAPARASGHPSTSHHHSVHRQEPEGGFPAVAVDGHAVAVLVIAGLAAAALGGTRAALLSARRRSRPSLDGDDDRSDDGTEDRTEDGTADGTEDWDVDVPAPSQPDPAPLARHRVVVAEELDGPAGADSRPDVDRAADAADHETQVGSAEPEVAAHQAVRAVGSPASARPSGRVILYDRRLRQRVAYDSPARLQWDGHDVACTTEDISMHGARLRVLGELSCPPPTMGTSLRVTLELSGIVAVLQARVGWQRSDGAGSTLGLEFQRVQRLHEELLQVIVMEGTPV